MDKQIEQSQAAPQIGSLMRGIAGGTAAKRMALTKMFADAYKSRIPKYGQTRAAFDMDMLKKGWETKHRKEVAYETSKIQKIMHHGTNEEKLALMREHAGRIRFMADEGVLRSQHAKETDIPAWYNMALQDKQEFVTSSARAMREADDKKRNSNLLADAEYERMRGDGTTSSAASKIWNVTGAKLEGYSQSLGINVGMNNVANMGNAGLARDKVMREYHTGNLEDISQGVAGYQTLIDKKVIGEQEGGMLASTLKEKARNQLWRSRGSKFTGEEGWGE
jgi:hypothetical protein